MYTYIIPFFSGVNNNNQQQQPTASSGGSRNNGNLDYEIDALDNFPDPASGDFDPTNSLSSSFPGAGSHPVDLEDIQVQNFAPEHFHKHVVVDHNQASEATGVSSASSGQSSAASQHIIPQQSMSKYINNNDMKDDLASSGSLGNISLAFSGLPGKSSTTNTSSNEAKASTSSSSTNSYHSSILESMTGPLSKRLRTLHSLQQQQSAGGSGYPGGGGGHQDHEAAGGAGPSNFKVNGKGKKSGKKEQQPKDSSEATSGGSSSASTSKSSTSAAVSGSSSSTASSARQRFDPEQDDDGKNKIS